VFGKDQRIGVVVGSKSAELRRRRATPMMMSAVSRVLWLRWRILVVNLGLRFVEWKIERLRPKAEQRERATR
jgi:hypothetical protein